MAYPSHLLVGSDLGFTSTLGSNPGKNGRGVEGGGTGGVAPTLMSVKGWFGGPRPGPRFENMKAGEMKGVSHYNSGALS